MKKKMIFKVLFWLQLGLLCLILLASAIGKFFKIEAHLENAANWGFPYFIMYSIALYELLIVFLLFKNIKMGLFMLALLMLGAIITHFVNDENHFIIVNLVILGITVGLFFTNKTLQKLKPVN
ncbi:hypothetical protein MTsPCn9_16030 [Croceitalea sp. MTPC9]|uniref:DoxX family protein n=1 Tax=unclassified Croceitalea TaxID=2632280 RepID=UPI002B3731BB|nr:hypothetical protein MTsPCn6_08880 [Croceitalea sp. MTPC6]GMN16667.1 hypothetical protein MTsPCn9_16030 [Croceitalea sp. MTPC9]